jgi:DNA-binding transcriptional ArsR family regulator
MGLTKTEIFTDSQNQLATLLKAMAHPARIAILQRILISNTCICGNLVEELGLAQATISQHLKELKVSAFVIALTRLHGNYWKSKLVHSLDHTKEQQTAANFFTISIAKLQYYEYYRIDTLEYIQICVTTKSWLNVTISVC